MSIPVNVLLLPPPPHVAQSTTIRERVRAAPIFLINNLPHKDDGGECGFYIVVNFRNVNFAVELLPV